MKPPVGQLPQGPSGLCVPLKGVLEASLDSFQAHSDPMAAACVNWGFEEPVSVQSVLLAKLLVAGYGLESLEGPEFGASLCYCHLV